MPRVLTDEVEEILSTQIGAVALTAHVIAANALVDAQLLGQGYPEALLKEIERWLAAHFACMQDPRLKSQGVQDAQTTYEGQTGMGLNASRYGQQAIVLDVNGVLTRLGQAQSALEVF